MSLSLTAHEQTALADVALVLSRAAHFAALGDYEAADHAILALAGSRLVLDVTPQQWGTIYDKLHRTGSNA